MPNPLYLRLRDLVGSRAVTPEEAAANRARGCGPVKPRAEVPGLLPVSLATLWRWVRAKRFPQPVRLGGTRVTAWRYADVQQWQQSQADTPST